MLRNLTALWRGEMPLGRAFWEFAIAYGTTANIVATVAAIGAAAAGLPDILVVGIFLTPLPYILLAVLGVFRSATRYQGPPEWRHLAKIAVAIWAAAMVVL